MRRQMTPVHGTWAYKQRRDPYAWYNATSAFSQYMASQGIDHSNPEDPFLWDGRINGARFGLRRLFGSDTVDDHLDWDTSGQALEWYCDGVCDIMFAHSHGGNVAAYAAKHGLKIRVLVTIATPVRKDMEPVWLAGSRNIGFHLHVHALGGTDWMQWFGQIGDGVWSAARQMIFRDKAGRITYAADISQGVGLMQHSRLISDPSQLSRWRSEALLDTILAV